MVYYHQVSVFIKLLTKGPIGKQLKTLTNTSILMTNNYKLYKKVLNRRPVQGLIGYC